MNLSQSTEFYWLTLTLFMTGCFWLPYIVNRMLEQGILNAIWDPFGDAHTEKPWARRMMKAHSNAIENLVIFAPLVILIEITGLNSATTATACMIYFFARLSHYIAFTLAIPVLRIVTFLTGFSVQILLAAVLLVAQSFT